MTSVIQPALRDLSIRAQLAEASQGAEIRWRDEDTSDAKWADHPTVDVKGDLPVSDSSLDIGESRVRKFDPFGHCR